MREKKGRWCECGCQEANKKETVDNEEYEFNENWLKFGEQKIKSEVM